MKALKKVSNWIKSHNLANAEHKILCAVSGGKDSVAMLLILKDLGYDISIAHVNFNLRGTESNADEDFVKTLAEHLNVPFHILSVDTHKEKLPGESIQITARRLRYNWFREICLAYSYQKIATAHSANDNAETIIYNLSKGTGLDGITGIPVINDNIIRPILCLNTNEIIEFLKQKNQHFRTDTSNSSDKYSRNKIRHHVIPVLEEINPAFVDTMLKHSDRFNRISKFYNAEIERLKKTEWNYNENGWFEIDISRLSDELSNVIFEHLLPLGFTETAILDVLYGSNSSEKQTNQFRIIKDRNKLLLAKNKLADFFEQKFNIENNGLLITPFAKIEWQLNTKIHQSELKNPNYGFLCLNNSINEITIRNIKNGDKIQPFGMKGYKLLSDLQTEKKMNALEKEHSLILEIDGEIAWWVGNRISNKFKVEDNSKNWIRFSFTKLGSKPFEW